MTFVIGTKYTFFTLAHVILGAKYDNIKYLGNTTIEIAIKLSKEDLHTRHRRLVNEILMLPEDPRDCTFGIFEVEEGETIILALEYIDMRSIKIIHNKDIRIDFKKITDNQLAVVKNALEETGVKNFTIKYV